MFSEQPVSITKLISEETCYSEDWSNDDENSVLATGINCILKYTFTFSHLADTFIQSHLQMRTKEAIKSIKENDMQVLCLP